MALALGEVRGELTKMLRPIPVFALFKKHIDRVKKKLKQKKHSSKLEILEITLD